MDAVCYTPKKKFTVIFLYFKIELFKKNQNGNNIVVSLFKSEVS